MGRHEWRAWAIQEHVRIGLFRCGATAETGLAVQESVAAGDNAEHDPNVAGGNSTESGGHPFGELPPQTIELFVRTQLDPELHGVIRCFRDNSPHDDLSRRHTQRGTHFSGESLARRLERRRRAEVINEDHPGAMVTAPWGCTVPDCYPLGKWAVATALRRA